MYGVFSNIKNRVNLPKYLIYEKGVNLKTLIPQENFIFISTRGDNNWGELLLHKSNTQFRDDYTGPTLAIDFIKTKIHDSGLGTYIMNFAKKYSFTAGCNGYIVLKADNSLEKNRAASIFYRKQNFTTFDKKLDKKLDKFIKHNKKGSYKEIKSTLMYYPENKKNNLLDYLKIIFQKFTNKKN